MQVLVAAALTTKKFLQDNCRPHTSVSSSAWGKIFWFTLLRNYVSAFASWKPEVIRKAWDMRSEVLKSGLVQSDPGLIYFY